jgi:toxin ParE1/3/4
LAAKELERIFKRIQQDNPTAAREVVRNIYDGCATLKDFPNLGRAGRVQGRRELPFAGLPYIAVYRVKEHAIEISRIWHGAQDWPVAQIPGTLRCVPGIVFLPNQTSAYGLDGVCGIPAAGKPGARMNARP